MVVLGIILPLILFGILAYHRANIWVWTLAFGAYFASLTAFNGISKTLIVFAVLYVLIAFLLCVRPVRRLLFSRYLLKRYRQSLPTLSSTEKAALEAGTIGWDGDLFSGMPNWQKFLEYPPAEMTPEEQSFLDNEVSTLCSMIDNWEITHHLFDMPETIWQYLREHGFFGIIIPKEFGGKAFSAVAHSAILTKIGGKSTSVASVVAVPNSLGPAELLLHYGTLEQKQYYLPRLAKGVEMPCFALTGPEAGSDAGAMPDYGIICKGIYKDREVLGITLNWNKRYITLAPVATVLGLAFKLYDPENLFSGKKSLGITCALIPTDLPGITIGRRHFPLNAAFPNGPTQGHDVFIPMDFIIGGPEMVGQGWRMLVECLAAGRAISLPSMACGGSKVAAYASGAYAAIRKQFHLPIGKFGGVEEVLAKIAGYTYIMEATRQLTVAAVARGEKPAVQAAISKYHVTELGRKVINAAMDIHGGKGICMGPKNYLASAYQETPISITVEGANILTRSMIIFGQGSVRCHPYLVTEMEAASCDDKKKGLKAFDGAIFAHAGFIISNLVRTIVLGLTQAKFASAPKISFKRQYQYFTRFSSALALVTDVSLISLGGGLKRAEKLSGRLGDVLSMLYLGSAVLKRYHDHGEPSYETEVVHWACQSLLYTAQTRLYAALVNYPIRSLGLFLRFWIFPLGRRHTEPTDRHGHVIADLLMQPGGLRASLAKNAYLSAKNNPIGGMEEALILTLSTEAIDHKVTKAFHDKHIAGYTYSQRLRDAVAKEVITAEEANQLEAAHAARLNIIAVDDFSAEELTSVTSALETVE